MLRTELCFLGVARTSTEQLTFTERLTLPPCGESVCFGRSRETGRVGGFFPKFVYKSLGETLSGVSSSSLERKFLGLVGEFLVSPNLLLELGDIGGLQSGVLGEAGTGTGIGIDAEDAGEYPEVGNGTDVKATDALSGMGNVLGLARSLSSL